jgi:thiol-disulfide isomerase/thioredoxin
MSRVILSLIVMLCFAVPSSGSDLVPATQPAVQSLAEARGGQDLIGTRMPAMKFVRWVGNQAPDLSGSVTLYRWWTDTCPFCARTLPAIEQLRKEFGPRGLKVVAVYHPKPARDVPDEKIAQAAAGIGYGGAIAVDSHWDALIRLWLGTGHRQATSASFLVDRQGIIRFVHPGVEFFPSSDPNEAQENADFQLLRRDIDALLPAAPATAPSSKAMSETDAEEAVAQVPEVGRFMDSIAKNSHGQSHGVLFSEGHPADAPTDWQIYVGEDRDDDGASCWHRFRVDAAGLVSIEAGAPPTRWVPLRDRNGKTLQIAN